MSAVIVILEPPTRDDPTAHDASFYGFTSFPAADHPPRVSRCPDRFHSVRTSVTPGLPTLARAAAPKWQKGCSTGILRTHFFSREKAPMPPSKGSLSNIEIAQQARMKPIVPLAKERLGIPEEHLSPFGHYKAKISLDYCTHLENKKNGKLILVTAISPTPGGRRQDDDDGRPRRCAEPHRQEGDHLPARAVARPGVRHEGRRGRRRLSPRSCRWRTSTSTSPATSPRSRSRTTCSRR